ncbi:hypothetical protein RDABS01_033687 [Bienertia sinuspersici]
MDKSLKPCTSVAATASLQDKHNDRLSNLPDELLIRILSLLPTKDAAATCISSQRLRHVLPRITSLDFDSKPISFCLKRPYRIEQFPSFVTFVDTVLQAHKSQYLTRFRLAVGADFRGRYTGCKLGECRKGCYPDLKSRITRIKAWISFPLNCSGLKELDLRIPVKEPGKSCQLPPEIFTCETLEVLKLDIDLRLDYASTMPFFHLPNLKLLELHVLSIPGDGFMPRLISSCPLLEDLTVDVFWDRVYYINISSPSLRRLCYNVLKPSYGSTDSVLIDTPNLEYLKYTGALALQYSISSMECLVKAEVWLIKELTMRTQEASCQQMLRFIRPLSNVQHLELSGFSTTVLNSVEVVDQLPVFHNLKCLELNCSGNYWDKVLLAFLKFSPVLETLVFPQGMETIMPLGDYKTPELVVEQEFCRTTQAIIPSCCKYYLKRIHVKLGIGNEREIGLIQFLLRHALVLEEFIISLRRHYATVDRMEELERTLQNSPRASFSCSIRVQDTPF